MRLVPLTPAGVPPPRARWQGVGASLLLHVLALAALLTWIRRPEPPQTPPSYDLVFEDPGARAGGTGSPAAEAPQDAAPPPPDLPATPAPSPQPAAPPAPESDALPGPASESPTAPPAPEAPPAPPPTPVQPAPQPDPAPQPAPEPETPPEPPTPAAAPPAPTMSPPPQATTPPPPTPSPLAMQDVPLLPPLPIPDPAPTPPAPAPPPPTPEPPAAVTMLQAPRPVPQVRLQEPTPTPPVLRPMPQFVPPAPPPPLPSPATPPPAPRPRTAPPQLPTIGSLSNPMDLDFHGPAPRDRAARVGAAPGSVASRSIDLSPGRGKPGPNRQDAFFDARAAKLGADWMDGVRAYWLRHRYYPAQAVQNGEDGTVDIELVVDRYGKVQSANVKGRSGSTWLDMAATGTFRSAQLPPVPPEVEAPYTFTLSIHYILIR